MSHKSLARGLAARIIARPTREVHAPSEKEGPADHVLQGYMQLLNTLLQHNLPLAVVLGGREGGLLVHLFKDCLFNGPTLEDHGPLSPPKVRHTHKHTLSLFYFFFFFFVMVVNVCCFISFIRSAKVESPETLL